MNSYYLIYIDKETEEVSTIDIHKTKKGYDEIVSLIKKHNNEEQSKTRIILSQDELMNKVLDFKNINKKAFHDEIRSITDQLRDIAYDIESKIESFKE